MDAVTTNIYDHYAMLTEEYGDAPEANSWDRSAQVFRWKELLRLSDFVGNVREGDSLLDFGCGTGDFYGYLLDTLPHGSDFSYMGIDVVPSMIEIAKKKYPMGEGLFRRLDVLEEDLPRKFTYIFANGIFNLHLMEEKDEFPYMCRLLKTVWPYAERGVCFNFISTYVNWRDEEMAYYDPTRVLEFCINELSRKVSMAHHYEKCDVCVWVER